MSTRASDFLPVFYNTLHYHSNFYLVSGKSSDEHQLWLFKV